MGQDVGTVTLLLAMSVSHFNSSMFPELCHRGFSEGNFIDGLKILILTVIPCYQIPNVDSVDRESFHLALRGIGISLYQILLILCNLAHKKPKYPR